MKTVYKYEFGDHGVALRHAKESHRSWVTHCFNSSDAVASGNFTEGFYWGHYFSSSEDATADFLQRCKDLCNGVSLSKLEREKMYQALCVYRTEG
jgi:hypothetical protein